MDKHFFFEGVTINPLEVQQESRMRQSAILSTGAGDACGGRGDWGGTETRGDREGPPGSVAVEKPRTEEEAAPGGCEAPRSGHTDFAEPLSAPPAPLALRPGALARGVLRQGPACGGPTEPDRGHWLESRPCLALQTPLALLLQRTESSPTALSKHQVEFSMCLPRS